MNQLGIWLLVSMALLAGCNQAMDNQPRYEAYEAAPQWEDDQSARVPVPGTVARGDEIGPPAQTLPVPLTKELLSRGRKQYEVFCTPCHGATGAGNGMVVQRGFPAPPSYHIERLRQAPLRHFYDVISEGYGVMYSYGARVRPSDRWAIAAYIRALQLSQNAKLSDLTEAQREGLKRHAQNSSPEKEESAQ
ncbi:MAG TPA: cytochrome c [Marinobacter sp.]